MSDKPEANAFPTLSVPPPRALAGRRYYNFPIICEKIFKDKAVVYDNHYLSGNSHSSLSHAKHDFQVVKVSFYPENKLH